MNPTYAGNLLLQKSYIDDPVTGHKRRNKGELPKYFVEHHHEAIISQSVFEYVQSEIYRRRELGNLANKSVNTSCFTNKLECGCCHRPLWHCMQRRKDGSKQEVWVCSSYRMRKKEKCGNNIRVQQDKIKECFCKAMEINDFDEKLFTDSVDKIIVTGENELIYYFKSGEISSQKWDSDGRYNGFWTEENRKAKSEALRRNPPSAKCFMAGKIWCASCGKTFQRRVRDKNRSIVRWQCKGKSHKEINCKSKSIYDKEVKDILIKTIGTDYEQKLDHMVMELDGSVTIYLVDGTIQSASRKECR